MGKKPKNKQDVSDKYELPFISVCKFLYLCSF